MVKKTEHHYDSSTFHAKYCENVGRDFHYGRESRGDARTEQP